MPTPPPVADAMGSYSPILEDAMAVCKAPSPRGHTYQQPSKISESVRREAEECAKLVSLPVQHSHAAGIDVGRRQQRTMVAS